ncbi:MAG: alpha/beta hydrolase [Crocosphaera sp.]
MIIVVSNREVNEALNNENVFGERINPKGINELRLAKARFDESGRRWFVDLQSEADDQNQRPSEQLFQQVVEDTRNNKISPYWVVFVHGFNQSIRDVLEWSLDLETNYQVNVLAFAWPSNQGGNVLSEYRSARRAARASDTALDRVFELLETYLIRQPESERSRCPVRLSLLFHSLGNFLGESLLRSPIHEGETNIFDNVIFHQADVDSQSHGEWIDYSSSLRTYVTINDNDRILRKSDIINPTRLGQGLRSNRGREPIYIDFSDGQGVGDAHNLLRDTRQNTAIQLFWKRVLTGRSGEVIDGLEFDAGSQTYRLKEMDLS